MDIISRKEAKEKGLTRFFTGEPCIRGHIAERSTSGGMCRECEKLRDRARQEYKTELTRKQYRTKPEFREKIKQRDKIQAVKHKERILATKRKYYREVELPYRACRTLVRNVLLYLLEKKTRRTVDYLGYSPEELKIHLEKQFKEGMSWENYGEWHIDHIKPIAAFAKEGNLDPKMVNALSNLQPLWAIENLIKGDTWNG